MRQGSIAASNQSTSGFPGLDVGFHAMKSVETHDGRRQITIHLTLDPCKLNWHQLRMLQAYLKSAQAEVVEGQYTQVMWYRPKGDKEVYEMGMDHAALFDMDFVFIEM